MTTGQHGEQERKQIVCREKDEVEWRPRLEAAQAQVMNEKKT